MSPIPKAGTIINIPTIQKKAIQESANRLKKLLEKNLIKIVLYGSYARGDYNNFSDIDIFILVSNKKEEIGQILNLISDELFDLDIKYNVTINPVIENLQIYNDNKEYSILFENIEKEGVVLYG